MQIRLLISMILFTLFLFCFSITVSAYPGGVSGRTLKGPSPGCTCHTSSTSSNVTLTIVGPDTLTAGQSADYQVVMTYTSNITKGGMDIASSNGTLVNKDSHLKILNNELTQPSTQNAGSTSLNWNFSYTAPVTPGTETLYATGCAVKSQWNHAANFIVTITSAESIVSITSPSGGENWVAGSTHDLTWTSSNVTNVKIEYSSDNGNSWASVIDSTAAGTGAYTWTIPNVSSSQCRVKLSDAANAATTSTSLPFTISPASSVFNISQIHINDANGVSLDTGMVVTVTGTITVANEFNSPSHIQDSTGGLAVFGRGTGNFSSKVKIGDVVSVTGKVVNYNGLTEINPVNSFVKLDSGKTVNPLVITIADIKNQSWNGFEAYEGMLIRLNDVKLATPSNTFAGNTNYNIFSGTDTTQIRITNGTTLVGQNAPAGSFDIIGALSQYKTSSPYNSGYQLLPRFITDILTVTSLSDNNQEPVGFILEQNYPNPFNPSTEIRFSLKENGFVTLRIFNLLGQQIAELINGTMSQGSHSVQFNASANNSGVYIYTLKAGNNPTISKKMLLLK